MNRPAPDTAWTVVIVVLLALAAGGGITLVAQRSAPEAVPGSGPAAPSSPAPGGAASAPTAQPDEGGSPAPAPSATGTDCRALGEDVTLRVLTLNTHGAEGPAGFDIDRLAGFLRDADVDVALLQEVDRARPRSRFVDMPRVLAEATGMEVSYGLNVRLGPRRGVSGLATLSRHPIVAEQHTLLPNQPGLKQRGVLRTDLDVGGETVSVFNTHLESSSWEMRLRQVTAVRGPVAATSHPAIVGGDLNATPDSAPLGVARGFLRDAWTDAGLGASATSPARRPRKRIDYLLYARPLRATEAVVMPHLVSDHRAVRAEFVLPAPSPEICVPVLDGAMGGDETGE